MKSEAGGKSPQIHFVSGKGGVGKSTFSLALAQYFAGQGYRTLLVELGSSGLIHTQLGRSVGGFNSLKINDNLEISCWSGSACLREYILYLLKVEALYRLIFENKVSRALIDAAPGLSELAILGKLTSGPPRNVGPRFSYDRIVLDAYSTGHFLSLLRAPNGFSEAIRFGPIAEQAKSISQVIRNSEIAKYHLITLPEELPCVELLELITEIKQIIGIEPKIWMNRVWPEAENTMTASMQNFLHNEKIKQTAAIKILSQREINILSQVLSTDFVTIANKLQEELKL